MSVYSKLIGIWVKRSVYDFSLKRWLSKSVATVVTQLKSRVARKKIHLHSWIFYIKKFIHKNENISLLQTCMSFKHSNSVNSVTFAKKNVAHTNVTNEHSNEYFSNTAQNGSSNFWIRLGHSEHFIPTTNDFLLCFAKLAKWPCASSARDIMVASISKLPHCRPTRKHILLDNLYFSVSFI